MDIGTRGEREPEHADGGEDGCEEDPWETFFGGDLTLPSGLVEDLVPACSVLGLEEDKVDGDAEQVTSPGCEEDKTGLLTGHAVERFVDVWVCLQRMSASDATKGCNAKAPREGETRVRRRTRDKAWSTSRLARV